MTRFRLVFILSLVEVFLLFACGKKEEKVQADPGFAVEQETHQPQKEELASEIEIEDEAGYIEDDFNSLRALPEGEELDFQEEGFAFPITYEMNYAQVIISPGTELHFLDHETKKLHPAKALENYLLVDEMFEHKVTTTDLETSIKPNLIFLGKKPEVQWISVTEVKDAESKEKLMGRMNLAGDYADAFKDSGGPLKGDLATYSKEVTVYAFTYADNDYSVLSYTFADYNMPAATFLVGPQAEYPLTGPCSFSNYPEVFVLGGKLYLQGGSSCCDCGIIIPQLFEFNGKELKAVLEDGSWST